MGAIETIVAIFDAAGPAPDPQELIAESIKAATSSPARTRARKDKSSDGVAGRHINSSSAANSPTASPPSAAVSVSSKESTSSHTGGKRQQNSAGGGGGGMPPETPAEMNLRLAFLHQTDLGNVFRFVERNRGKLLYNESLPGTASQGGGWLWWDARRWAHSGSDARVRIAEHECVQAIADEAKTCAAEAARLARENDDIVERAPKSKGKSDGKPKVDRGGDNVITVDFRAKKKTTKKKNQENRRHAYN